MVKLSLIAWCLSADSPLELSSKMFDLNFLNQKRYEYFAIHFDTNLNKYCAWYFVDVLTDKPLEGLKYDVTEHSIEDALKRFKLKKE